MTEPPNGHNSRVLSACADLVATQPLQIVMPKPVVGAADQDDGH